MKKFIITLKEESEILESIITLLESNGIIEVEEVKQKHNCNCIGVVGIDEVTKEKIEFDTIKKASEFIDVSATMLAKQLDTKKAFKGYYWYKVHNSKLAKIKI